MATFVKPNTASPSLLPETLYTAGEVVVNGSTAIKNVETEHQPLDVMNSAESFAEIAKNAIAGTPALVHASKDGFYEVGDTGAPAPVAVLPQNSSDHLVLLASGDSSVQSLSEQEAKGPEFEDIASEEQELEESDEELWDELDDMLFEDWHNNKAITVTVPSEKRATGLSAKLPTGAISQSSAELSTGTISAAALEGIIGPLMNTSQIAANMPQPATQQAVIVPQVQASSTSSISFATSASPADNLFDPAPSLNSTQNSLSPVEPTPSHSLALSNETQLSSSLEQSFSGSAELVEVEGVQATTASEVAGSELVSARPNIGWSDLPLELREKIYRELLLVDMRQEQHDLSRHHIHPNILRVNKQILAEASNTLYLRNTWVRITMGSKIASYLENRINGGLSYRRARPDVRLRAVVFSREAALDVVIRNARRERKNLQHTSVVSGFAMSQICRALTMPGRRYVDVPRLRIALDAKKAPEGAIWDQKGVLDCFAETSGLWRLEQTKLITKLAEARVANGVAQMAAITSPSGCMYEQLRRTSTYLERGRSQARAGLIYKAVFTLQEGADYVDWLVSCPYGKTHSVTEDAHIWRRVRKISDEFIEGIVSCSLRLGDLALAKIKLLSLYRRPLGRSNMKWADAYYTLGLIEVARGVDNAAAYSFLRALHARPGFKAADKAVEELYERVRGKTDFEHIIVRHNIENILEPFRYQPPYQDPIDDAEARRIIGKFVGRICALDSNHIYSNTTPVSTALPETFGSIFLTHRQHGLVHIGS